MKDRKILKFFYLFPFVQKIIRIKNKKMQKILTRNFERWNIK